MIDNDIANNNNPNTKNGNIQFVQHNDDGASSVIDADKMSAVPFIATAITAQLTFTNQTTATTRMPSIAAANNKSKDDDDVDGRYSFEVSANAFNIETIVVLLMFSVCTIIYSSK